MMNLELNEYIDNNNTNNNIDANLELASIARNSKKKFRLKGKNFFLTYPKCLLERQEVADLLLSIVACECIMVAKELHMDGLPHIHVFLTAKKKVDVSRPTYFDVGGYHGNYQTARNSDDVVTYINKSDKEPYVYGQYIGNNQTAVQKRAIQNKALLGKSLPDLVDEGLIHISQYKQMKEAIQAYTLDKTLVPDIIPRECIWIYGKPGIGKSLYVRDNHPQVAYFKAQNKWWDGYTGEKVVLLDDFDMGGQCLGHYLKIWADQYSFVAEVKGGTIKPTYEKLYITSNYLPREIWCPGEDQTKWDTQMTAAIERRFRIVEPVGPLHETVLVNYIN